MNSKLLTMALQLSTQDIFSSSWFSSALMNRAWTEILRSGVNGISRKSDPLGAALGGRLRGDAAMLRQASANVAEARLMMDTAAAAAANITGQLQEAQKLAEDFNAAAQGMTDPARPDYQALHSAFQARYEAVGRNIDSIIKNTFYNGMALLDGTAWGGDERLSVQRDAANVPRAASVHIQAGESGFPLMLGNMETEFFHIDANHALTDAVTGLPRQDTAAELHALHNSARNLADLYAGRAGSLQNQANSLQSQAKILEEAAAARAKSPEPVSPENLLLNLALRDSGSLFSLKS